MRQRILDALSKDLVLKLTALGLAFLLWTIVQTDNVVEIDGIPVQVLVGDAGWSQIGSPDPATVTVEFTGPVRQMIRIAAERPPILLTVDEVTDSTMVLPLRTSAIALGPGMEDTRVESIRPLTASIRLDRVTGKNLPVSVVLVGTPVPGFERAGPPGLEPPVLRATGPSRLLAQLDTIRLPAIDLGQLTGADTLVVRVESIPGDVTLDVMEVRVVVPLRPVSPDTALAPAVSPSADAVGSQ